MSKWFSGPPPSVGWWPASTRRRKGMYRWWDGHKWSYYATEDHDSKAAAQLAGLKASNQHTINWQHRPKSWPARSRT